ncbi:hypothetical protein [Exiguobacterium sp. UBA4551]|uniref:hypothetical protein n=1 Tax=Exiguobacterium sp. UBA4551 TaxID=1946494 RepID=UPI00257F5B0B|nr:hypothetical protein [Exiguobacterium sp. UBA4551]
MTTIYFSKMNLNSHIFDVYESKKKRDKLNEILKDIYTNIRDGASYEDEIIGYDKEGNTYEQTITYKLVQLDSMVIKDSLSIVGRMVKNSEIITKKLEENGVISKIPVNNDEVIEFFFDIEKEILAYNRTNRFGHKDINDAFEKILNKIFKEKIVNNPENEMPYYVLFENIREGISIENLKKELKALGKITELTLEIIPPNPDGDLLDDMDETLESYLEHLKEAKITHRKLTLTSRDAAGLQIEDEVVNNEIEKIGNIHSKLSSEDAIENGYVSVQASSQNGLSFSTRKSKVRTAIIDESTNLSEFANKCKSKIQTLRLKIKSKKGNNEKEK